MNNNNDNQLSRQRFPHGRDNSPPLRTAATRIYEEHLRNLNTWGPLLMGAAFAIAGAYGVLVAIPALYDSAAWRRAMQLVACTSFIEVIAHWYLTRSTDSSYSEGHVTITGVKVMHPDHDDFLTRQQHQEVARAVPHHENGFTAAHEWTGGESLRNSDAYESNSYARSLNGSYANRSSYLYDEYATHSSIGTGELPSTLCILSPPSGFPSDSSQHKWAWSYCHKCALSKPPRCHHCPVCRKCILKRHHHCFFTGVCVGAANQRHFLAFMIWANIVTVFGSAHMFAYALLCLLASGSAELSDFVPVFALYHAAFGSTDPLIFFLSITCWVVCGFTVAAAIFLFKIIRLTALGVTDIEYATNLKITDTRPTGQRLRDVLGENWVLNFLSPFRRRTQLTEDAINWPHMKASMGN